MKKFIAALVVVSLSACAAQPPLDKVTQSGYPEATYPNQTQDAIQGRLLGYCGGKGFNIRRADTNLVECSKALSGTGGLLMQAMTNPYARPEAVVSFTLYTVGGQVKVLSRIWFETRNAYGAVSRNPSTNTTDKNNVQAALDSFQIEG